MERINAKHVLKLLAIIITVFLIGYFLEVTIDEFNVSRSVENIIEIISELFSVFVAFSIFSLTWDAYSKSRDNHSLLLGSNFLIFGILILFHVLSYPFMPDFVTANSMHKATYFMTESRLAFALLFLASVYVYKDTLPKLINKYVLIISTIALSTISFCLTIFYHDLEFFGFMPENIASTATKFFFAMITCMVLYAGYLYARRAKETGQNNLVSLACGSIIIAISNLVYFSYEFSGHLLIITGFYFIYLGLYKSSVELPYERLAEAEEKLRMATEDKYRNLFDNANDAIITTDSEDTITSWNRSAEKIFGWEAQEVIGRKLSPLIVPDDLREKREQFVRSALTGTGITRIETERLHKDGSRIDVSLTISPMIDSNRKITGLSVILRDIRERKQIEKEKDNLLKAINNSNDGIIIADERDRYIYLNEAYEKIYGYSEEELIGETWQKLASPESISATELELDRTIHNKNVAMLGGEFPVVRKDGITIPIEARATGLWDEKGSYQGHICIIRDITDRKQAEEQIMHSLKEKEVLLREIHHRVKNNMQIVSSLLWLQSKYITEKKYREMFKDSQNRIMSMSLIHEKLYRSKDMSKIDINEYITALANNLFESYGVKGAIALNINVENILLGIDSAIPCGLIINELISNSLKYGFPNGRKGEIMVSLRLSDGDKAELAVGDNGVGIPDDVDFRKTKSLGLRLITMLAEDQLQGEVNLDRSKGTEFKIKFKGWK
ncbi:PAS fold protein [uncultured archaeon]|nr:PAS fold protein [uncultured archaeon]